MGLFDRFRRNPVAQPPEPVKRPVVDVVGANRRDDEEEEKNFQTFSNSNITFSGELNGFDY